LYTSLSHLDKPSLSDFGTGSDLHSISGSTENANMRRVTLTLGLFSSLALAIPIVNDEGLEFHTLEARQQQLPLVKLPYATYQASSYDPVNDVGRPYQVHTTAC
jgi:hypothetical protein